MRIRGKNMHLWVFAYKDDETILLDLGDGFYLHGYENDVKLPPLQEPWHYRMEFLECDCEEYAEADDE